MTASYPSSVRTFSPKQDDIQNVMAAHVNDLQDEVSAIERTLGALAAEWDNGSTTIHTYPSVKARLDDTQNTLTTVQGQLAGILAQLTAIGPLTGRVTVLETDVATMMTQITSITNSLSLLTARVSSLEGRVTALENGTGSVPTDIAAMQAQINALIVGLSASITNTGQTIAPDPYDWTTLVWNRKEFDNAGIYRAGSSLVCPKSGTWIVNLFGLFPNTRGGATGVQCLANLELRREGNGIVSDSDQLELGIGGYFRMNCAYNGVWEKGEVMTGAVNFNSYNAANPSISARIGLTFMHS